MCDCLVIKVICLEKALFILFTKFCITKYRINLEPVEVNDRFFFSVKNNYKVKCKALKHNGREDSFLLNYKFMLISVGNYSP